MAHRREGNAPVILQMKLPGRDRLGLEFWAWRIADPLTIPFRGTGPSARLAARTLVDQLLNLARSES